VADLEKKNGKGKGSKEGEVLGWKVDSGGNAKDEL
jgi:hypothetical protein